MPPATVDAFRDHGDTARTVDQGWPEAEAVFQQLAAIGIPMDAVTDKLLTDGLASFQKSFDGLVAGIERKSKSLGASRVA